MLGPSGYGKSTLLRLATGLEPPTAGGLFAGGQAVTGPDDPSRVLMFQDPTLYPWRTIRANVGLGLEARSVLKRLGATGSTRRCAGRAGGLRYRLPAPDLRRHGAARALARALVNDPGLLILDEPLGKLDSLTRLQMQAELVRVWQGRGFTALLVTHDLEEALLMAGRVVVVNDRPAISSAELPVPLAYPRHRDDPELVRLRRLLSTVG